MPDKRSHRGRHPQDDALFARSAWASLREAVRDLSWLLSRGYADKSSLKLVGDRFALTERQRTAVMRCACSDFSLARRRRHEVAHPTLAGATLLIDGYNTLTTIEAALAGGVILLGRDGCYRDMASMHGTFRKVEETAPALVLIGETLDRLEVQRCVWYLDSPVSNSGRLKQAVITAAEGHSGAWTVQLVTDPDPVLSVADDIVASADSLILDHCQRWFNLAREVVASSIPQAGILDLSHFSG